MAGVQEVPVTVNPERVKAAAAAFKRPAYWMLCFGWGLAACAGIINVTGFRVWGCYVSHVTGSTTAIGMKTEELHQIQGDASAIVSAFGLVASFILGAYYSGMLIDKNAVQLGGKAMYGIALVSESVLLFLAVCTSPHSFAAYAASAACGVQNAMCTSHFGAVVRTTHVTGTATDIGSALGRLALIYLRNGCCCSRFNVLEQVEAETEVKRLIVLVPMWTSFLLGGLLGAFLEDAVGVFALLVPAGITMTVGVLYSHFRQQLKETLKAMDQDQISELRLRISRTSQILHFLDPHSTAGGAAAGPAGSGRDPEKGLQAALDRMTPEEREDAFHRLEQETQGMVDTAHQLEASAAARADADAALGVPAEPAQVNPLNGEGRKPGGAGRRAPATRKCFGPFSRCVW